ncbi:hypothetical protein V8F20_004376 [Naviculisporaceae sp. PSN 640]
MTNIQFRFLQTILAVASILVVPVQPLDRQDQDALPDNLNWKDGIPSDDCVWTCGVACYWLLDVHRAMRKAEKLLSSDQIEGYPHQFENHEGFDFPTPGPWYEFPIMWDYDVYSGGDPGPDRIVIATDGQLEGLITHTGAPSNDSFIMCIHDDA